MQMALGAEQLLLRCTALGKGFTRPCSCVVCKQLLLDTLRRIVLCNGTASTAFTESCMMSCQEICTGHTVCGTESKPECFYWLSEITQGRSQKKGSGALLCKWNDSFTCFERGQTGSTGSASDKMSFLRVLFPVLRILPLQ